MDVSLLLSSIANEQVKILDPAIPLSKYTPLDISIHNASLGSSDITNPQTCQTHIDDVLAKNKAEVAFGGYLEKRNLYSKAEHFAGNNRRDIHLGIDFWSSTGIKVITPIMGTVHSFNNNNLPNDYGPTIILSHHVKGLEFYSLYGHLSVESLNGLEKGMPFAKGQVIGTLGSVKANGGYAPHLHFQLILDLQGNQGDYPGVCSESDLPFYSNNCPNPNLLLNL